VPDGGNPSPGISSLVVRRFTDLAARGRITCQPKGFTHGQVAEKRPTGGLAEPTVKEWYVGLPSIEPPIAGPGCRTAVPETGPDEPKPLPPGRGSRPDGRRGGSIPRVPARDGGRLSARASHVPPGCVHGVPGSPATHAAVGGPQKCRKVSHFRSGAGCRTRHQAAPRAVPGSPGGLARGRNPSPASKRAPGTSKRPPIGRQS
jgi:hypothetical protein